MLMCAHDKCASRDINGREVGSIFDVRYSILNIEYRTRKETAVFPTLDKKPGFPVCSN